MRILSVVSGYSSGGAETLVRNLSREFVRRGHRCHVLVVSRAADIGNSPDFEAEFMADLDAHGITHGVIGHDARRNVVAGARRLRRAVRSFRPDMMHVHVGHALLFQALGLVRVPTVYSHHNIRLNFPAVLFRLFDRFVDRYVAICRACEAMLRQRVSRPVRLVYNGVPPGFAGEPRSAARLGRPTVLSLGALTGQKDYPTLVRAAASCVPRFAAAGRSISFRIAGSGAAQEAIERTIAETGMEGHVELLGTRSDIPRLMAEADLLVNSSRYEGFPLVLIEASLSALPIVATDVGGNSEIVEDGASGRLVPPGRPDLLAERIWEVLADDESYAAFSAEARARAERFTLERCVDDHLRLYEEISVRRGGS